MKNLITSLYKLCKKMLMPYHYIGMNYHTLKHQYMSNIHTTTKQFMPSEITPNQPKPPTKSGRPKKTTPISEQDTTASTTSYAIIKLVNYTVEQFYDLMTNKYPPLTTTNPITLIAPSFQMMMHTLDFISSWQESTSVITLKLTADGLSATKGIEPGSWNWIPNYGFSFVQSLPLLRIYQDLNQGYALIIHTFYKAMLKCVKKPAMAITDFTVMDMTFSLWKTNNNSVYLTTTNIEKVWTVYPWLILQLTFLMANLYPITFPNSPLPSKLCWNTGFNSPTETIQLIPLTYQMTPEKYLMFCKDNSLTATHGILYYMVQTFKEDNNINSEYYDNLQVAMIKQVYLYHQKKEELNYDPDGMIPMLGMNETTTFNTPYMAAFTM